MSRRRRTPTKRPSVEIKFDCVPFNGTQGETYDKWERALLKQAPGQTSEGIRFRTISQASTKELQPTLSPLPHSLARRLFWSFAFSFLPVIIFHIVII